MVKGNGSDHGERLATLETEVTHLKDGQNENEQSVTMIWRWLIGLGLAGGGTAALSTKDIADIIEKAFR
jgi:hypothetical protein